ncbi:MAG: beta-lactamase family protein [Alphaproteobacteria bacterium]|nr:beta-lactamase family protein [Alphaproteobacteria bacterium]
MKLGVRHAAGIIRATLLFLFVSGLFAATAAETAPAPPAPASPLKHELSPADIESFLDGLVALQIESNDIAGATISIVKDGQVLFAKGYGFADMKARTPVSAETTLFRVGSITKTFTWTAVMQLVEQGKLDLDADVNTYLDFKIPPKDGKPVTLRNLMTHRGGFQEAIKGLGAQNTGKVDLGAYLRNHLPDQIFTPGSTPSYSNYGAALAGYIVERVAKQPFDAYLDEHIYKPLGMTHTSIAQPLPAALEPQMSKGYQLASGEPIPFEIVNGYPAGSQSSSAIDMTKFMIAHLEGGALGEARILKPETIAQMHNTVTTLDPRANGIALGFYEEALGELRTIGHGGDTVPFHSDMHLIPSQRFGFFVSYNSTGRGDIPARSALWRKFRERYFGTETPTGKPLLANAKALADEVVGAYVTSRRADTSMLRALTSLSQATVTANDDGTITVDLLRGLNGQPRRWEPLAKGEFREVNGSAKLIFIGESQDKLQMLTSGAGVLVFQRTTPAQSATTLLAVAGGATFVLLLNLIGWPLAAFVRRRHGAALHLQPLDHGLRFATMAAIAALLTFVIGIFATLVPHLEDPWSLDEKLDPTLRMFQYVGIAGAVGALFAVGSAVQSWRSPMRSFFGRLKESIVALAYLGLLWFAWAMNLFDFTLRY